MVTKRYYCKLGRVKIVPVLRIIQQFFNYLSKSDFLYNFQAGNASCAHQDPREYLLKIVSS